MNSMPTMFFESSFHATRPLASTQGNDGENLRRRGYSSATNWVSVCNASPCGLIFKTRPQLPSLRTTEENKTRWRPQLRRCAEQVFVFNLEGAIMFVAVSIAGPRCTKVFLEDLIVLSPTERNTNLHEARQQRSGQLDQDGGRTISEEMRALQTIPELRSDPTALLQHVEH